MATIEELNEGERDWVDARVGALRQVGVDARDAESLGQFYDRALADWLATPEGDRPDPNALVNMIGVGLGECILGRVDLRWVIATDEFGTELALHREGNEVLVYPPTMVGKRWSERTSGFIPDLVDEVARSVRGLPT